MKTLWFYCKAVGRHWWALMSCALFTALGVYALHANKSNDWMVKATFVLAGFCLLIACFLAWLDEHKRAEKADTDVARLNKKYFDERPRVTFAVSGPKTFEEWHSLENVSPLPIFRLEHSGGRVARFVKVDPVQSSLGRFRIEFDQASILNSGHRQQHPLTFTVHQNDALSDLSYDPRILKIQQGVNMLLDFFRNHSQEANEGTYRVTVRYRDQDDSAEYAEEFILKCEYQRMLLSVQPNPQLEREL